MVVYVPFVMVTFPPSLPNEIAGEDLPLVSIVRLVMPKVAPYVAAIPAELSPDVVIFASLNVTFVPSPVIPATLP